MILADQIESRVPNRNGYAGERCRRLFQMKTQSNISGKTREQEWRELNLRAIVICRQKKNRQSLNMYDDTVIFSNDKLAFR